MRMLVVFGFSLLSKFVWAQQYDALFAEKKNFDLDNRIYQVGKLFSFDYEIIENDLAFVLKENKTQFGEKMEAKFELELKKTQNETLFKMFVKPILAESERTNENQTQIVFTQKCNQSSFSSTGLIENDKNIWLHPIREGFFSSLEACPFPCLKFPLKIGNTWQDSMLIGEAWCGQKWGVWNSSLLLHYHYQIDEIKSIITPMGVLDCYVISSTATSSIGTSKLKSYFNETYGFVRYEYEMVTGLKVNIWLTKVENDRTLNDARNF